MSRNIKKHTDWKVKKQKKEDVESRIHSFTLAITKLPPGEKVKERFFRKPYGKLGERGSCYAEVSG